MGLSVLILAAGLGSRLRPLTEQMPKPLVPLVDASVLAHQVRLARTLGDVPVHVNAHYLSGQIIAAAPALGITKVWVEQPEILGTGGPLQRMWAEGERGELLVLNGDCYSHFDLPSFVRRARASGASCALLARSFPQVDTLRINPEGHLSGIANRFGPVQDALSATFTGTSWYSPEAWENIRAAERDIRDYWERLVLSGCSPWVDMAAAETSWIDMGDPAGLMAAVQCRLAELTMRNWVDASHPCAVSVPDSWEQSVVHAGAQVGNGAVLKQTILFPGARVEAGEIVVRQIRAQGVLWQL